MWCSKDRTCLKKPIFQGFADNTFEILYFPGVRGKIEFRMAELRRIEFQIIQFQIVERQRAASRRVEFRTARKEIAGGKK